MSGRFDVGGLVGENGIGRISNSLAFSFVTGDANVGGLIGINKDEVTGSFVSGSVNGTQQIGGLVGNNILGYITSSTASGSVNGTTNVGGLAGNIDDYARRCSCKKVNDIPRGVLKCILTECKNTKSATKKLPAVQIYF